MTPPERRCGTCRWHAAERTRPDEARCIWAVHHPCPFWASPTGYRSTRDDDGAECRAWDATDAPTVPILHAALAEARTLAAEAREVHRQLLAGAEVTSRALAVEREPFVLTLTDLIERLCAALGVRHGKPPGEET